MATICLSALEAQNLRPVHFLRESVLTQWPCVLSLLLYKCPAIFLSTVILKISRRHHLVASQTKEARMTKPFNEQIRIFPNFM